MSRSHYKTPKAGGLVGVSAMAVTATVTWTSVVAHAIHLGSKPSRARMAGIVPLYSSMSQVPFLPGHRRLPDPWLWSQCGYYRWLETLIVASAAFIQPNMIWAWLGWKLRFTHMVAEDKCWHCSRGWQKALEACPIGRQSQL